MNPLDLDRVHDVFGDDVEDAYEVLKTARDAALRCVDRIDEAVRDNDVNSLLNTFHDLKGFAGNVGAGELAATAEHLEARLQRGEGIEAVAPSKDELRACINRLTAAMEALRASPQP